MESFSFPALMKLLEEEMTVADPGFDWIYIDGSHEADDTFLDAELAWRLARRGAVFIFDDYDWNKEPKDSIHHPKRGIDAFMLLHQGEFEVLSSPSQYQMVLQKTNEMRIGFLDPGVDSPQPLQAFDYDIHVALTIDSSYAMPAAAAIRSAIKHTPGRMSFYIVDLGLKADDREKLKQLVSGSDVVTLVFLSLSTEDCLAERGATWSKISMLKNIPVERVLYLDADVLVRRNLRALWETDLKKKPIGAVVDVGHPMGHAGVRRGSYFNAGVLLLDLAKVRSTLPQLVQAADERQSSRYKDQDALNAHFRDDWLSLDLKWNAQGLGTYAECAYPDRNALDLEGMKDASIVHFTGPVDPTLPELLNPFVQPCTAKPWGYAGSPGHPFEEEWWAVLEETPWKGWRSSTAHIAYITTMRDEALADAVNAFNGRTTFGINESHDSSS